MSKKLKPKAQSLLDKATEIQDRGGDPSDINEWDEFTEWLEEVPEEYSEREAVFEDTLDDIDEEGFFCAVIPPAKPIREIPIPGGGVVSGTADEVANQLKAALAPMLPFFDVLEVIIAAVDTTKKLFEAFGKLPFGFLSVFPEVVELFNKVIEKVEKLIKLHPLMSIPVVLVAIINVILDNTQEVERILRDIIREIENTEKTKDAMNRIGSEKRREKIKEIIECKERNVEQKQANLRTALDGLNALFVLLNLFLPMVGGPKIEIADIDLSNPKEAISGIAEFNTTLRTVRDAIPIP